MARTMSVITKADARRLLDDAGYRAKVFGEGAVWVNSTGGREWLTRIALGFTPCSGPRRHRGDCSGASRCIRDQYGTTPAPRQLQLPFDTP